MERSPEQRGFKIRINNEPVGLTPENTVLHLFGSTGEGHYNQMVYAVIRVDGDNIAVFDQPKLYRRLWEEDFPYLWSEEPREQDYALCIRAATKNLDIRHIELLDGKYD